MKNLLSILQTHSGRRRENTARRLGTPTHFTLYCGQQSRAVACPERPGGIGPESPWDPCSIHVHSFEADRCVLELRNVPMSEKLVRYLLKHGATMDDGQRHTTARLRVRSQDTQLVWRLAAMILAARRGRRIDRFRGVDSRCRSVADALCRFASLLESASVSAVAVP